MKLIVGLGNPGSKYEHTRHNFGFLAVEALAARLGARFQASSYKGELAQAGVAGGDKVLLLKPQTYMNKSGESAAPLANFYKIAPQDVLVVYDDLDLPLGRLRFAAKGSAGGHNGIKSMIQCLGTQDFPRLKLGIGRPPHPAMDVVDYVLQKFAKDEAIRAGLVIDKAVEALGFYLDCGEVTKAANQFNGTNIL